MRDRATMVGALFAAGWFACNLALAQANFHARLVPQIGHTEDAISLALDRDEKFIATAGEDNVVVIWDARSERIVRRIEGHQDRVTAVDFTPDGQLLTTSSDGTMRSWNILSGAEVLQTPA